MRHRKSTLNGIDMAKCKVGITVIGEQQLTDGSRETTEFYTEGSLEEREDGFVLCYRESELTGMEGTETEFFISDGSLTLRRTGEFCSLMQFAVGVIDTSSYETPYGPLSMEIKTEHLETDMTKHGGKLCFTYTASLEHQLTGRHTFTITVKDEDGER